MKFVVKAVNRRIQSTTTVVIRTILDYYTGVLVPYEIRGQKQSIDEYKAQQNRVYTGRDIRCEIIQIQISPIYNGRVCPTAQLLHPLW